MTNAKRFPLMACVAALGALALVPAAHAQGAARQQFLVSLGDSYAVGYQPKKGSTKDGFVYQIPGMARKRGYNLKVVNFGCGGATVKSMMEQVGCPKGSLGPGAKPFDTNQVAAASDFIRANRSRVALITVSISGNDVTKCVKAAAPVVCVAEATDAIKDNLGNAAKQLREAAGDEPVMVGTTYPDVVLGAWVHGNQTIAKLSVAAFQQFINPMLESSYAQGQGQFVDVTARTGAYGDMDRMVKLAPYGSIPKPVADVCRISWYCGKQQDIHLNRAGYGIIARMVTAKLPKR